MPHTHKQRATSMTEQIFNADALKHFNSAIETIINSDDLTFWDDRRIRSTVEINGLPYDLCINPSFYGYEKSMYLMVTLRHGEEQKQKRVAGSIFCELNLSMGENKNIPTLFMRTQENTNWGYIVQNEQGEVIFDEESKRDAGYSLEIQSIQSQFTKSFSCAMSKIGKKMLDAEVKLTKLYQEKVAEDEARSKAAEAEFEKFMQGYRRVTEEEAVAMKETLNATGSVEFIVILRVKPQEVIVTITRTEDGYEQTIGGRATTTTEDKVDETLRKARIKLN